MRPGKDDVPARALTKLFGRRIPLAPEVEEAIEKLRRMEAQPDLRDVAGANAALLEAMYTRPLPVPPIAIDPAHAATKQAGGVPLLRGEPPRFYAARVRDRFLDLCRVMEERGNPFAAELRHAARSGTFPIVDLATEVLAGDPHAIAARAADADLDAGLAATLLRLTLFPALAQLAAGLQPLLDTTTWRRGYCPVCGAWPLLGEYRGLELARFLRCGLCATAWEVDRLVCPFCENRVPQDLVNLAVEGEEQKHRAVACRRCHCYVKQISTLAPIPPAQLLVADVATLHLDLIALDRAYSPPQ